MGIWIISYADFNAFLYYSWLSCTSTTLIRLLSFKFGIICLRPNNSFVPWGNSYCIYHAFLCVILDSLLCELCLALLINCVFCILFRFLVTKLFQYQSLWDLRWISTFWLLNSFVSPPYFEPPSLLLLPTLSDSGDVRLTILVWIFLSFSHYCSYLCSLPSRQSITSVTLIDPYFPFSVNNNSCISQAF